MRHRMFLVMIVILGSAFLFSACSKKEEVPQAQGTATQEAPAAAPANDQLAKAVAAHRAFMEAYQGVPVGPLEDTNFYQRRIDVADKARSDALMLLNSTTDPQAQQFLTKFTDLLQQYSEAGRTYISACENIQQKEKELADAKAQGTTGSLDMLQSSIKESLNTLKSNLSSQKGEFDRVANELKGLK
jgi:hypothetical protein